MSDLKLSNLFGLSPEWLTWLYFAIVDHDGIVVDFDTLGPNETGVQVALGKKVVLRDAAGGGAQASMSGAGLDDNGEVLQAIRRGACVSSLSFDFAIESSRVYSVTLNVDGSMTGVKLPDLFTEPDEDAAAVVDPLEKKKKPKRPKLPIEDVFELRMTALAECEAVIDNLYAEFLRRRVDPQEWANDVATIRRVVALGLEKRRVDNATAQED